MMFNDTNSKDVEQLHIIVYFLYKITPKISIKIFNVRIMEQSIAQTICLANAIYAFNNITEGYSSLFCVISILL